MTAMRPRGARPHTSSRRRPRPPPAAPPTASFSSLRDLPFTELKLHALFVKNCAVDVTNAAICQTAIDLAHRFGSVVVAEGIDAIADLQALIVMGCDFGQGTLLAPPLPKERFLDALRQHSNKPRAADHASQEGDERVA